jgi:hypothetical protein
MAKIVFKAQVFDKKKEFDNTTWQMTYKIMNVSADIPKNLSKFLKSEYPFPMPLSYWGMFFKDFGFNVNLEHGEFKKFFLYDDEDFESLIITLTKYKPLTDYLKVEVDTFVAYDILKQMGLQLEGKMHPEKFEQKLNSTILITEDLFGTNQEVVEILLQLENLAISCLEEEYLIVWFKEN